MRSTHLSSVVLEISRMVINVIFLILLSCSFWPFGKREQVFIKSIIYSYWQFCAADISSIHSISQVERRDRMHFNSSGHGISNQSGFSLT